MRWTPEQYADYIQRRQARYQAPRAVIESPVCDEPVAEAKGEASHTGSIPAGVTVISYRRRLIDPDNLCPKFFIDCLRYAGIVRDDCAKEISLTVSQVKVQSRAYERTEITVERII